MLPFASGSLFESVFSSVSNVEFRNDRSLSSNANVTVVRDIDPIKIK